MMETLPVTLIVKAPNQQIEDQTVQCELSWTIQKLKQHLSEVYPSRPPRHEQKLIYSGQLLSDTVTLKEVLRHFEGQETHTVHLVCTPRYSFPSVRRGGPPQGQGAAAPPPPVGAETPQPPVETGNEGNVEGGPQQNLQWTNGGSQVPLDANQYAMQLAWMQQAYFQYMTQYMQLAASSYNATLTAAPAGQEAGGVAPGGPVPAAPQPQANPVEQPAQPEAAPAAARDPDNLERDWLDVFYMLSRALVLFSVVYFYSSPIRFIFVLLLGIGLYLYQIGFFRNINHNNNNNNAGPPDPQVPEEEQAPSRFMVVWTFFATFFASLIPEIPNAV